MNSSYSVGAVSYCSCLQSVTTEEVLWIANVSASLPPCWSYQCHICAWTAARAKCESSKCCCCSMKSSQANWEERRWVIKAASPLVKKQKISEKVGGGKKKKGYLEWREREGLPAPSLGSALQISAPRGVVALGKGWAQQKMDLAKYNLILCFISLLQLSFLLPLQHHNFTFLIVCL